MEKNIWWSCGFFDNKVFMGANAHTWLPPPLPKPCHLSYYILWSLLMYICISIPSFLLLYKNCVFPCCVVLRG